MKKYYLVYCAYPYTEDPQGTALEIGKICQALYKKHTDLILIIPHFTFDAPISYDGRVIKWVKGDTNFWIAEVELALIMKADILAYDPKHISPGVAWEISFATLLDKPILSYEELMEGKRLK